MSSQLEAPYWVKLFTDQPNYSLDTIWIWIYMNLFQISGLFFSIILQNYVKLHHPNSFWYFQPLWSLDILSRLAVSCNCGAKTLFDARTALPSPVSFQPLGSSTDLVPPHFGHSSHPQKHLCTDSCRPHTRHGPQATKSTLAQKFPKHGDFPGLVPAALPSNSWCRASTRKRMRGMDIPFVLALETPIFL